MRAERHSRSQTTLRLPRKWYVSISAVEVCILNAERLLLDATKTSGPTSAALAELSIEEAAKAWMLYFRLLLQGRKIKFAPRFTSIERLEIEKYLESHEGQLRKLDDEIITSFKSHKVKLQFLSFLLGYVEKVLPIVAKNGRLKRLAEEIHGPALNLSLSQESTKVSDALELIKAFRLDRLTELDAIKQRGFYVNLTEKGDVVSPEIDPVPSQLLISLATFLIVMLKGDLIALSK